jgi:predicted NAD-dependent protein-ADP-ribosyltransferase YbiA (DUF1768 family)
MYWYLNKQTNTPAIVGSIPVLVKLTGFTYSKLEYYFSRQKLTKFEDDVHRIEKLDVQRSLR